MSEWILSGGTCKYVAMELYIKEQSQSIEGNTTQLYWELRGWYTTTDASYWYSDTQNDISVTINGDTVLSRAYTSGIRVSIGTDHPESSKLIIASGTKTVQHSNDGSKSCSITWSFVTHWNPSVYTWGASKTLTLTTIPRASQPSCVTWPETTQSVGDMGSTITIYMNSKASAFRHVVRYAFGSRSGVIAAQVQNECVWEIPLDLAKEIPSAPSGTGHIYVDTYTDSSGQTLIGTKSVAFVVSVPESIVPTLSVEVSEAASIPSALSGMYIQGKSRLKVKSTATGQYEATIKSYLVEAEGKEYTGSGVTTETISGSGTVDIKVTVTDSRGRTTAKTVSVTVTAYSAPKLTSVTAYRCRSAEDATEDKDGEYICVKPKGSITSLGSKNAKTCTVYYKKSSASSYSSVSLTMGDYKLDSEYVIFSAEAAYGYAVYADLRDSFSSVKSFAPDVLSAFAFIDILLDEETETEVVGVAVGKQAETEGAADIGWDLITRKKLELRTAKEVYELAAVMSHGSLKRREYRHDANGTKAYYLIASATLNANYQNAILNLLITRTHPIGSTKADILNVAVRRNDGAGIAESKIAWATPHVSDGSQWHLVIDGAKAYVYLEVSGQYYTFDVQAVTNSGRVESEGNPWALTESDSTGVSSLPSGTDIKASAYDTGWTDITLSSGVAAVSYVGAKVRRIGSMVNVRFGVTGATAAFQVLGTIPAGYRPPQEINVGARYYNKLDIAVAIEDTGEIKCLASNVSYDSSALLAFNTTYFI